MKKLPVAILFCFIGLFAAAQPYFLWNDSIPVKAESGLLPNPWAGGLNFVQVSSIDLNLDGVKDLFVFDRTGNKIRTFIKTGGAGTTSYKYDPSYEKHFPVIFEWVLLADYNCDGKEDIFCYSSIGGGFDVYKNTSSASTGLQFQKVVTQQLSAYFPDAPPTTFCSTAKPCNLYVSPVDVPALCDIDNDGDLDVVTFEILSGSTMIYHKNMSKEKYGHCDSLIFQVANNCWGYATEHPLNNTYKLHDTCFGNINNPELTNTANHEQRLHAGSAEMCIDLNGDGVKEFIVGDISYPNLTMLTNGGTVKNANFIAVDTSFPAANGNNKPVNLTLFPCPFFVDVDGDDKKDLIVSPNATNASENFNSILYYKNTGTNNIPYFEYKQSNFLQDQMLDFGEGAYPTFFDYDNDGLQDLFVGNYGYYAQPEYKYNIAYLKNTGTPTQPQFELINRDFDSLSSLHLPNMTPSFGDLDGDGDSDMLIGDFAGNLYYLQNTAPPNSIPDFKLIAPKLKNSKNRIIDIGDDAAPQIVDVDNDGKNDVIIGRRSGEIAYYRNVGVNNGIPILDSITHFWGEVNVLQEGYVLGNARPFLFKKDSITKLFVGAADGHIHLYDHIDGNLEGKFNLADTAYQKIYQGTQTAPAIADINKDGLPDLMVGNFQGGLSFYKGVPIDIIGIKTYDHFIHFNFDLFPNPAKDIIQLQISNETGKHYIAEIYNMLGQHLNTHLILNNRLVLNVNELQQGMYVCKVFEINANGQQKISGGLSKRFIIQH